MVIEERMVAAASDAADEIREACKRCDVSYATTRQAVYEAAYNAAYDIVRQAARAAYKEAVDAGDDLDAADAAYIDAHNRYKGLLEVIAEKIRDGQR